VEAFSLEGLQIANGIFDPEKLKWMNGKYIAAMPIDELYIRLTDYLRQYHPDFFENTLITHEENYNKAVLQELQKRLETLEDFISQTDFFYSEPTVDTALLLSEKMNITTLEQAKEALQFGLEIISGMDPRVKPEDDGKPVREILKDLMLPKIAEAGKKNGQILWPLRVALTGKEFSPGAFEMTEILGLEKAIQRIEKVLQML
jgi:glutamyl/glutaminyl-tRNA synthetase